MKTLLIILALSSFTFSYTRSDLHIGVSFALSAGAYGILKDLSFTERIIHSALFSLSIGTAKEYADHRAGGIFDIKDIRSDLLGISLALAAITLINPGME